LVILKMNLNGKRGQAGLILIVLTFVVGVLMIFNVALPIMNSGLVGNQTAGYTTATNISGYTGAVGVGTASYIVTVLAVLALAAFLVMSFFKGGL
jgi:hypothetical protein